MRVLQSDMKGDDDMGTDIRPELSEKNHYWIERHRYYELKHFCLQYPLWKKAYSMLDGLSRNQEFIASFPKVSEISDPTQRCATARAFFSERMRMIERIAYETDPTLSTYILKGVTQGVRYDYLRVNDDIPCCKDVYYELYRRFFWLLSKERN